MFRYFRNTCVQHAGNNWYHVTKVQNDLFKSVFSFLPCKNCLQAANHNGSSFVSNTVIFLRHLLLNTCFTASDWYQLSVQQGRVSINPDIFTSCNGLPWKHWTSSDLNAQVYYYAHALTSKLPLDYIRKPIFGAIIVTKQIKKKYLFSAKESAVHMLTMILARRLNSILKTLGTQS